MIDAASTQINLMAYDRSDDLLRRGIMGWYLFTAICLMHTTDRCYPQNLDPRHPFRTEIECIYAIPTTQVGYRNSAVSYPAASWCEKVGTTQQEAAKCFGCS